MKIQTKPDWETRPSLQPDASNAKPIEILSSIWLNLLHRTQISANEDFFELGGTPELANCLFSEIGRVFRRELSPLTIYQNPTISTLAAVLETPDLPRFSPIVPMRPGSTTTPIFMVPGLAGTVMELFKLAKHLDSEHPIYGLQPQGMDGVEEPLERIEDQAQFYLDGIRALQPHGPYMFIGYSVGGLVALEMAQRIYASGENVAMLAFVDTYPHPRHLSFSQRTGITIRRLARSIVDSLRRTGRPASESYDAATIDQPRVGKMFAPIMKRTYRAASRAWRRYDPQYYNGKISFVKGTQTQVRYPTNPVAVWADLADELEVDSIPGGHLEMLSQNVRDLAIVLSHYLHTDDDAHPRELPTVSPAELSEIPIRYEESTS